MTTERRRVMTSRIVGCIPGYHWRCSILPAAGEEEAVERPLRHHQVQAAASYPLSERVGLYSLHTAGKPKGYCYPFFGAIIKAEATRASSSASSVIR